MQHLFEDVLKSYNQEYTRNISHQAKCYDIIRHKIPEKIRGILQNSDFLIDGSCGIGQMTHFPWIAIYGKNITLTAQKGIYIAFLFRKEMDGFFLTLLQGITDLENRYKPNHFGLGQIVADYYRNILPNSSFSKGDILLSSSPKEKGYGYQATTILSKKYFPGKYTTLELEKDIRELSILYSSFEKAFSEKSYDSIVADLFTTHFSYVNILEADEKIQTAILKESPKKEARILSLSEVEIPEVSSRTYTMVSERTVSKKTDYVKKAKKDGETGLTGEQLVLHFEEERLRQMGHQELKPKWVSKEYDGKGYDIQSFDIVEGKKIPIFIEVKTTNMDKYSPFFISQNEVETSRKLTPNFWIYRVYEVESENPKFYRIHGKLEDSLELNPSTFVARLKPV